MSIKLFLLIFILGSTSIVPQDELNVVRSLKVDSLNSELPVYFTPGYRQRAEYLAGILTETNHYFRDSLGVEYDYSLAVLDETQWNELNSPYPYRNAMEQCIQTLCYFYACRYWFTALWLMT